MALKLNERYPGRFNNPSPEYPQGSFKNRTAPSAKDGSYLEKDWANDKEGFFQSLLSKSGYVANGLVDKVGSSQYYDALVQTFKDKAEVAWAKVTGKPTTLSGYGITDVYTITQTNSQINARILRENITAAGLENNDPNLPFMLRESDGKPYFLQPRLGFTPADKASTEASLAQCIKLGQYVPARSNPKFCSTEPGPIANLSTGTGAVEFYNGGVANASAVMTLHRHSFAAYFGLDTDNQLKIGGWSMGNVAHTILHSGNFDITGVIVHFPFSAPPDGFLRANGAAVSRSAYPKLFARIGTAYGAGDGSSTFNLPDLRGEFIRGWDHGRGVDAGRVIGSWQADELKSHTHAIKTKSSLMPQSGSANNCWAYEVDAQTGATGGSETRPRNFALLACIKY